MRILLFVISFCILAATGHAQDETATSPSAPASISLEDGGAQDAAIGSRINDIRQELDGLEEVRVRVSAGVVQLSGEVVDPLVAEEFAELAGRVEGVVAVENSVMENTELTERLVPAFERIENRLASFMSYLPLAAVAFLAAALVWVAGFALARWDRPWQSIAPNAFIAEIYRQIVRIVFVIAGLVLALDILGAAALLGTILGAAGIVGLAIGFAVRDTVENFIASVMLSVRQPFQPNDLVEIEGDLGKVIRLTSRATILLSRDGNHIRIPNATVFKARIVNFTRNQSIRFEFDIGVEAEADLAAVREMVERTIADLHFVLKEPRALVWIETINETGVVLRCTGWIDQSDTNIFLARGAALREVKDAIEAFGVSIPDTTYRIRLDQSGGIGTVTETARDDTPKPRPPVSDVPPEPVQADAEAELDRLIDAERHAEKEHDLLSENGKEE